MASSDTFSRNEDIDFLNKLLGFHHERGTPFDPEPKLGNKPVNLRHLYTAVKVRGGYDHLSATRLAWRDLSKDFGYGNDAISAFNLKTVFYKYLAAYAIRTEYNRTPPPPEILERVSAKGGDLLHRTMENYTSSSPRPMGNDPRTANARNLREFSANADEANADNIGRRLRPHPTPAQHFQPDMSTSRQSHRNVGQSPDVGMNGNRTRSPYNAYRDPNSALFDLNSYMPPPADSQNVHALMAPNLNTDAFERQKAARERTHAEINQDACHQGVMRPGTGFTGPNIYFRCLMSLKCPILDEQEFAVHHFVRISHQRGDKFRFVDFVGLDDALLARSLETASLFYNVDWDVSYDSDGRHLTELNVLDGCYGTPNLLEKIESLHKKDVLLTDMDFTRRLNVGISASLVLRNMLQLEDNALYEREMDNQVLKDWLVIALNYPTLDETFEIKVNALEICTLMTRYYATDCQDPLFKTLVGFLQSNDYLFIINTLQAIVSYATEHPGPRHQLINIPEKTVQQLLNLLLLKDDKLTKPVLDFFYQYTRTKENIYKIIDSEDLDLSAFCRIVSYSLDHAAVELVDKQITKTAVVATPPKDIPQAPEDFIRKLHNIPEPERSAVWLKCCFRVDAEASVTQIDIWRAYQSQFAAYGLHGNLQAAEFIKNVSTTFRGASAQVVPDDPEPQYLIMGIRPGHHPMDVDGLKFIPCLWATDKGKCGRYIKEPMDLYNHVVRDHLGYRRNSEGGFDDVKFAEPQFCHWNGCQKFRREGGSTSLSVLRRHLWVHMPYELNTTGISQGHFEQNRPRSPSGVIEPEQTVKIRHMNTPKNEEGPCGIAYVALLVLRNIADVLLHKGDRCATLVTCMWELRSRLVSMVAENQTLGDDAFEVLDIIDAGDRLNRGRSKF